MATIRKRNGKYQVQVRVQGHAPVFKTFTNKALDEKCVRKIQSEIEQGIYKDTREAKAVSFLSVSTRYIKEVLPQKNLTKRYFKVWNQQGQSSQKIRVRCQSVNYCYQ